LLWSSYSGQVEVLDARSGKLLRTLRHERAVLALAVWRSYLAAAENTADGEPGKVVLWHLETGKRLGELTGHAGTIWSVAFSPNGSRLVSGGGSLGQRGEVRLWDLATGQEVLALQQRNTVHKVAFSRDGRYLLIGGGVADREAELDLLDAGRAFPERRIP
jgi:WD40 repeat protein